MFFQHDAYYKDTIAPQYDVGINYSADGTITTAKLFGVGRPPTSNGYGLGGVLLLNGETTHVRHVNFNTNNDRLNTQDLAPFMNMDTTRSITPTKYYTDGYNTMIVAYWNYHEPTAASNSYYSNIAPYYMLVLNANSTQLVQNGYVTNIGNYYQFAWNISGGYGTTAFPIYRNPSTGNLVWIANGYYGANNGAAYGYTPIAVGGAAIGQLFNAAPTSYSSSVYGNRTNQFLGVSKLDGFSINFHNAVGADYQQFMYKYNDSANTMITLASFLTPPPPVGTGQTGSYTISTTTNISTSNYIFYFTGTNVTTLSTFSGTATVTGTNLIIGQITTGSIAVNASIFSSGTTIIATGTTITAFGFGSNGGGHRATNYGNYIPKYASKTFTDTSTSTNLGFYVPFVDQLGNYVPIYYTWNTLADTFTQFYNVTMNYATGTSISSYWAPDTLSAGSIDVQYGSQRCWYNEIFVSSGTRYLMLMQLHGGGGIFDSLATYRTFPTYRVNPNDPKQLTYVSKIEVPATPKNIVWLSDDRTIIGIVTHSALYIYTFSASSGWTQTGNFPFQFWAVGRDNLGRVWGVDPGPGWGRLHLITLNVPVNIVVTTDASAYYYSGSSSSANLTVNAYSYTGARIATSVKLVIDGGSMTFAGSNLTKTITTSASGDTVVPVTITGGGVANIIASASLS
jgi:hypothetical protein